MATKTKGKETFQEVVVEKKKSKNNNRISEIGTELEANVVVNTKSD
jgi:hypothetical protein